METPTYIVLGTSGNELVRMTGFVSSEDLIKTIEKVLQS